MCERNRFVWSIVVLAMLAGTPALLAQEATTGSIAGQVVDAQGLPVPGVTVTVSALQGSKLAVTDGLGNFLVPFLTPGVHRLRA
jgi:hypothetical protein